MELPKRKDIHLREYDYSRNGAYFVTVCTENRAALFADTMPVGAHPRVRPNAAAQMCAKWLKKLEEKYEGVCLDYYTIMPDHVHAIIFIDRQAGAHAGAPLHEMVKWFKTQSTNEYIKGVKAGIYPPYKAHMWQRRYYEHVIRNDADLYETRKYIEENWMKRYLTKETPT